MSRKREDLRVPVERLRYNCDPEKFSFKNTSEVEPLKDFVGQDRAIKALEFGLGIEAAGYNIFVTGLPNTGRTSLIYKYLRQHIEKKNNNNLKDLCFVYNFANPNQPKLLILDKGQGKRFKIQMESLTKYLERKIPEALQSEEHLNAVQQVEDELQQKLEAIKQELDRKAKEKGIAISTNKDGDFKLTPLSLNLKKKDQPMSEEEFASLTLEQKKEIAHKKREVIRLIEKSQIEIARLNNKIDLQIKQLQIKQLEKQVVEILKSVFVEFCSYKNKTVIDFLKELENFIKTNLDLFLPKQSSLSDLIMSIDDKQEKPQKNLVFRVNLLVDNSQSDLAPVILENYPSFSNLFGKIERRLVQGAYVTDHTQIKAGSLLTANNGYLIVNAWDLLINAGVWEKLKKTLETGFLKIQDIYEYFGYHALSIEPEPIPINVKVIVICDSWLYYLLTEYDRDFQNIFKVRVEFDYQINLNPDNLDNYAKFITFVCREENLLPFSKAAVAKIVEYSIRLVADQKKLSAEFGKIKDILIEANYWAKKEKAEMVQAVHIQKTIDEKKQRAKLIEEHYQEFINRGILMINTEGEKIGQINSLVVLRADPPFGLPVKITAKTFVGNKGVVSIQRQVGLAGPIHNTGVEILSAYLNAQYGQEEALSLSASICFEQNYSQVEGDSATAAELVAIISSLANLPVDQSLSITGSMNQNGEIQPIGGVNEKIEGFFDVCQARGLTGKQGVIIPHQNIDNLALREDVIEAIKNEKFQIYAVKTIEEALELLMNREAVEIHNLIKAHFDKILRKNKKSKKTKDKKDEPEDSKNKK